MKKKTIIIEIIENDGAASVSYKTEGFTVFEKIGILKFYLNQMEKEAARLANPVTNEEEE